MVILKKVVAWLLALVSSGASALGGYSADKDMVKVESNDIVEVQEADNYTFFDNKECDDTAIIFYGGAKVDEQAYTYLLESIAETGVADVYLVKCNLNLPIFDMNKADDAYNKCVDTYDRIYFGGHSLGGSTAEMYAVNHTDKVDGLIYLASYGTKELPDSINNILYVYGENDLVLNKEKLEADIDNMKEAEKNVVVNVIEGGNHAGFGCYGAQQGDGEATITNTEQIAITVSSIYDFIG